MKSLKTINLLPRKKKEVENVQKVGKYLSLVGVVVLIIFLVVYSLNFVFLSYLTLRNKSIEEKISILSASLNQKKDTEAIWIAGVSKLVSIEEIIQKGQPFRAFLEDLFNNFTSGIKIISVAIQPNGEVKMDLTAPTSEVLNDVVVKLLEKEK
ncbi:hypothetical protein HY407_03795, partial [Candidatus Gottesmanbacteria bacterium]|nr:hypothetical protein [Candidatus Gottesmanbacteria bacterium]